MRHIIEEIPIMTEGRVPQEQMDKYQHGRNMKNQSIMSTQHVKKSLENYSKHGTYMKYQKFSKSRCEICNEFN